MTEACGKLLLMMEQLYPSERVFVNDAKDGGIVIAHRGVIATYKSREEIAAVTKILADRCEREDVVNKVVK